jgi:hypothetical protein
LPVFRRKIARRDFPALNQRQIHLLSVDQRGGVCPHRSDYGGFDVRL